MGDDSRWCQSNRGCLLVHFGEFSWDWFLRLSGCGRPNCMLSHHNSRSTAHFDGSLASRMGLVLAARRPRMTHLHGVKPRINSGWCGASLVIMMCFAVATISHREALVPVVSLPVAQK